MAMPIPLLLPLYDISAERAMGFWVAMALMAASLLLFHHGRKGAALAVVVASAFAIGLFMAMLDPFLWMWDEMYHALVAKHILLDPLRPTLYHTPVLPYDYRNWTFNHVWLHKQPLFLWQMALSIKLFGTNELAVRLPSVVMHALVPLMVYRIGSLTVSRAAGFYAAMLFAFANYPLELLTGLHATDHNDIAFLFYTCASLWAWAEHHRSGTWKWALAVGLFAGCAILNKWLAGLLVFGIWGLASMVTAEDIRDFFLRMRFIAGAFVLCVAVVLPWQLHIHSAFPAEAGHELEMVHRHFSEVVEGHAGDLSYHFDKGLKKIYGSGDLMALMLALGLVLFALRTWDKGHRWGMIAGVAVVYGFYSLAATKMTAFTLIASPVLFIGLGTLSESILNVAKGRMPRALWPWAASAAVGIACVSFLDPAGISRHHGDRLHHEFNGFHNKRISGKRLGLFLRDTLQERHVIFNTGMDHGSEMQVMFYSDHIAYGRPPSVEELEMVRERFPDLPIAVIQFHHPLPDHVLNDPGLRLIPFDY